MTPSTRWKTVRNNVMCVTMPLSGRQELRVVFDPKGKDVAYCPPTDDDGGNANARLIAAAPLMLDVLEHVAAPLVGLLGAKMDWPDNVKQAVENIHTAINEAKGT